MGTAPPECRQEFGPAYPFGTARASNEHHHLAGSGRRSPDVREVVHRGLVALADDEKVWDRRAEHVGALTRDLNVPRLSARASDRESGRQQRAAQRCRVEADVKRGTVKQRPDRDGRSSTVLSGVLRLSSGQGRAGDGHVRQKLPSKSGCV